MNSLDWFKIVLSITDFQVFDVFIALIISFAMVSVFNNTFYYIHVFVSSL